jgi:hypothetical protein
MFSTNYFALIDFGFFEIGSLQINLESIITTTYA